MDKEPEKGKAFQGLPRLKLAGWQESKNGRRIESLIFGKVFTGQDLTREYLSQPLQMSRLL